MGHAIPDALVGGHALRLCRIGATLSAGLRRHERDILKRRGMRIDNGTVTAVPNDKAKLNMWVACGFSDRSNYIGNLYHCMADHRSTGINLSHPISREFFSSLLETPNIRCLSRGGQMPDLFRIASD